MNYQGIVNWLQEDDFVIIGFTTLGESALMEKETGVEVSDLPAFLIASVLPVAKRKVVSELQKQHNQQAVYVQFTELAGESKHCYIDRLDGDGNTVRVSEGEGETLEQATVHAIENYIKQKEKNQ